jgi:hypothetical protein
VDRSTSATTPRTATQAGRQAFAAWREVISARLVEEGPASVRTARMATAVIAAIEGGVILCLVEARKDILLTTGREFERCGWRGGGGRARRRSLPSGMGSWTRGHIRVIGPSLPSRRPAPPRSPAQAN